MLKRFVYLDSDALRQYASIIDGGELTGSTRRATHGGDAKFGVDAKLAKADVGKSRQREESQALADTDSARFDRLLAAAASNADDLGWVDVVNADSDLTDIFVGAMVTWDCEAYVPDAVKMLAKGGEARAALDMFQQIAPLAKALGADMGNVPDESQMSAMSGVLSKIDGKLLVVGERDDTDWRMAGHLEGAVDVAALEGSVRIVGKVSRILGPAEWQPFITFPGMNLIPREQRRKAQRTPPTDGTEENYLRGPALMLDILAIYR